MLEKGNKKWENNLFALNWNKMSLKEHKKSRVTGWNTNRLNTEHSENVSLGWGKDFEVFLLINTRFISQYLFFGFLQVWQISFSFSSIYVRFGKLGKTQGKPYCNSKAMGIHFPQPIFMSIFEKKLNFLATWLSSEWFCV